MTQRHLILPLYNHVRELKHKLLLERSELLASPLSSLAPDVLNLNKCNLSWVEDLERSLRGILLAQPSISTLLVGIVPIFHHGSGTSSDPGPSESLLLGGVDAGEIRTILDTLKRGSTASPGPS